MSGLGIEIDHPSEMRFYRSILLYEQLGLIRAAKTGEPVRHVYNRKNGKLTALPIGMAPPDWLIAIKSDNGALFCSIENKSCSAKNYTTIRDWSSKAKNGKRSLLNQLKWLNRFKDIGAASFLAVEWEWRGEYQWYLYDPYKLNYDLDINGIRICRNQERIGYTIGVNVPNVPIVNQCCDNEVGTVYFSNNLNLIGHEIPDWLPIAKKVAT